MRLKVLASVSGAGAWSVLWTSPGILASACLVMWGAEAAQVVIGPGLALAALAWLQTLPEFAVEGVIAWHAGEDPRRAALAIANLTGAIRLLVGLGWPLVYAVHALAAHRHGGARLARVVIARAQALAVLALVPPLLYFGVILAKGSLTVVDALVLGACYAGYLVLAARAARSTAEPIAPGVARWALARAGWRRVLRVGALWGIGGALLVVTAQPFFNSMLALAAVLGIAPFLVVQWLAPILTEIPELVSAVSWARRVTPAPTALLNLVASAVNQWTVLAAMIPVVFGWAHWRHHGGWTPFLLDPTQRLEVLLALLETAVGVALLASLELGAGAAAGLFGVWVAQVAFPDMRPIVAGAYGAWLAVLVWRLATGRRAFALLGDERRSHG